MKYIHVNKKNQLKKFNKICEENDVLIYYYASYCGWCKKFDPTWVRFVEKMGKKKDGYLAKIEKEFMGDALCKQEIMSFPTILYTKNGKLEDLYQGDRSLSSLVEFLKKNSEKSSPSTAWMMPRITLRTPGRSMRTPRRSMRTPRRSMRTPRRTLRTPRRSMRTPRRSMRTPRLSPIRYPTPRFIQPKIKRQRPKTKRGRRSRNKTKGKRGTKGAPKYEPGKWNKKSIKASHNCYDYFLNKIDKKRASKCKKEHCYNLMSRPRVKGKKYTCKKLQTRMLKDYPSIKIAKKKKCPNDHYMGALAVDPKNNEFHYYRKDRNGKWSHKNGPNKANNTDYDGKRIEDAKKANRRSKVSSNHYSKFCNYYCLPNDLK